MASKHDASLVSSIINLTKNVLAAGVVSLPYTFTETSIIPGIVLLCVVATLSGYSFLLIARACVFSDCYSYQELAKRTYGKRFGWWVDVIVLLYTGGSVISYLVVIGDWIPHVFDSWDFPEILSSRAGALCLFTAVFILPLSFLSNLDPLKFTSSFGLLCMLYACALVIKEPVTEGTESVNVASFSPSLFRAIPVMTVSFAAHYSGPKFFKELGSRLGSWKIVVTVEAVICTVLYIAFALAGYLAFGSGVSSDVLDSFDDSDPILWARLLLSFSVIFTIPFAFLSVRNHLANVLYDLPSDDEYSPKKKIFFCCTLLAIALLMGIFVPDVELVIAFKGSLFGTFVIFVFPGMFYLKTLADQKELQRLPADDAYSYRELVDNEEAEPYSQPAGRTTVNSTSYNGNLKNYQSIAEGRNESTFGFIREMKWQDTLGPLILIGFGLVTGVIGFVITLLSTIGVI